MQPGDVDVPLVYQSQFSAFQALCKIARDRFSRCKSRVSNLCDSGALMIDIR
jgi:hypothetical protein